MSRTGPAKAYVIMQREWDDLDGVSPGEEFALVNTLYYDFELAVRHCTRLVVEFCERQTPEEFEIRFDDYAGLDDLPTWSLSWPQCFDAGIPYPFRVQELTAAIASKVRKPTTNKPKRLPNPAGQRNLQLKRKVPHA